MKPTVAIVGGSGFIGNSLARHFAREFKVKIIDLKPPPGNLKDVTTYIRCDIRNYEEILNKLRDVDLVIHTAIVQIPLINENKLLGYEVNLIGTQAICKAVEQNPNIKGLILSGTWHTVGEKELKGTIDEEFGFRPDKVEERARMYALSKIAQESIVRFYDEMSNKIYGIIRMGTVLGKEMPEKTAANVFIERGLKGEPITPYKHSMHRPMLYVDIGDICHAFEVYAKKILNNEIEKGDNSIHHIFNIYYPEPITILELANVIRESIIESTVEKIKPDIDILDKGLPILFKEEDKNKIEVNIEKARMLLGSNRLKSPKESIREIVKDRISQK